MSLAVGGTGGPGEARQGRAARAKPAARTARLRLTPSHLALYGPTWKALKERTLQPTTAPRARTCA